MAPECVEVYLKWNLEFSQENLNPLRPLQDLPRFYVKIGIKVIKSQKSRPGFKKIVKSQNTRSVCCDFTKKINCIIFAKKNDKKQNERKSWELTVCTIVPRFGMVWF